jgi:hypothetical protein
MSGSGAVFARARTLDDATLKRFSQTTAFGTAGVSVSVKPGRLYKIRACNSNATTRYFFQIFDKASAPVNTDVPIWEMDLPAAVATTSRGDCAETFELFGLYLKLGLGIAISTTKGVLTLAAATDATAYGLYTSNT